MFALVVAFSLCETQAEVQEILVGNWTAYQTTLVGEPILPDNFSVQIEETDSRYTISILVFEDKRMPIPIHRFKAVFDPSSKGKFGLFSGNSILARFDFSPIMPPHIHSTGNWGDNTTFTGVMITNMLMQLSLVAKDGTHWQVITFEKEDGPPLPWYEQYFKLIFMSIVFLGSWAVTKVVQSCVMKQRLREAEEILRKQAEKENVR